MIKKFLFHTPVSDKRTSLGLLILRLVFGLSIAVGHGWGKLTNFNNVLDKNPLPFLPDALSMGGAVFSQVVCGFLVAAGLMTRAAAIPLAFTMSVAAFVVHGSDPIFNKGPSKEMALLFLASFIVLFITGPGRYSADNYLP